MASSSTPLDPVRWAELEAKYKQDIENLTESTEMATIEKEIAEERLDCCERELQELKDKLAEALIQIDMLTKDNQANTSQNVAGHNESAATILQLQKVEEQNEILKQALVKLRTIAANDKDSLENLRIEHEELQIKYLDLTEREQKYQEQIKVYEEQIDVCQSAQEIAEKLTQQKTELEDKLREVMDDLDCMEKLRDLNEQILESARENEIELTGQLDKLDVQYSELSKKKRDLELYVVEQERSLSKLKEENIILSEQMSQLRDQFKEGESIEQQKHQIENVSYKLNFSETKMAEKESEINRYKRNLADMQDQMNNLSMITKEQAHQIDDIKAQLDSRRIENAELQRALKKKMEEVSELEIRRDMAEKKLQTLQRETETKLENLNRTIETMKGIEVQREEEIKRLMEDNELIERERRELRDQLSRSNRSLERSVQTADLSSSMVTALDTSLGLGLALNTSVNTTLNTSTGVTHNMSLGSDPNNMINIPNLNSAFETVNKRNYQLEMELALKEFNQRVPPYTSKAQSNSDFLDLNRVKTLISEAQRLKREYRASIINQRICPKVFQIRSQIRNDNFNKSKFALRYFNLQKDLKSIPVPIGV